MVITWDHSKKGGAQKLYLESCYARNHPIGNPCIYQTIFKDRNGGSGARTHTILGNGEDAVEWCYEKICSSTSPLALMETPWPEVQENIKLYVDWDMDLGKLLNGNMSMQDARDLAMRLPSQLSKVMIGLGMFREEQEIRVLFKEGTRKKSEKVWKISFHFIWEACMKHCDYLRVWNMVLNEVKTNHPKLYFLIAATCPTGDMGDPFEFPGYESFIGIDLAPIRNIKQGLATAFSSKHVLDDCSRLLGIATFVNGEEVKWERPDEDIYIGRAHDTCSMDPKFKYKLKNSFTEERFQKSPPFARLGNSLHPAKVKEALALASICICSTDCVRIGVSPPNDHLHGASRIIDEVCFHLIAIELSFFSC